MCRWRCAAKTSSSTQGEPRATASAALNKNLSYELLKVNVLVSGATPRGEQAFHVDTLDLYSARQRGGVHEAGSGGAGRQGGDLPPRPGPGAA